MHPSHEPSDSSPTIHYQIGVVRVALTTPVNRLRREHTSLYRAHITTAPDDQMHPCVHVRVAPARRSWRRRRRFLVSVNNRVQFEPARRDEVLPYVEWAINWEVPQVLPRFLQLHASSLVHRGCGLILPGDSGSGKSTLTAGLVAHGWRYLCDEFALIDAESLELHPYPRAICIKKPSFEAIESVGLKTHATRYYLKGSKGQVGYISPADIGDDVIGGVCPVRYVVFPKYARGAEPTLTPMSRAEAAFALHRVCFNLLHCEAIGLDVIAGMVRNAECYRLQAGELSSTVRLLDTLVAGSSHDSADADTPGAHGGPNSDKRGFARLAS